MAKRDDEYRTIQILLTQRYGAKVLRHTQRGRDRKIKFTLPDDSRPYVYTFSNARKDRTAVFKRDLVRAINRLRHTRKLPQISL